MMPFLVASSKYCRLRSGLTPMTGSLLDRSGKLKLDKCIDGIQLISLAALHLGSKPRSLGKLRLISERLS